MNGLLGRALLFVGGMILLTGVLATPYLSIVPETATVALR